MIARFQVLLPYTIAVPVDQELPPHELRVDDRYTVVVYPPHRAGADRAALEPDSPEPLTEVSRQLDPFEPQPQTPLVLIEGSETVLANALRIDFSADDFDRRTPEGDDPPIELCFQAANHVLARLRTLGRAGYVKPIGPRSAIWHIRYLNDDESELPAEADKLRGRFGVMFQWKLFALNKDLWAAAHELGDVFDPTPWDTLLLDGVDLFPEVGPSLVLAYAAIETRISKALDILAIKHGLSEELWSWVTDRGHYLKNPSVAEQLHDLLYALTGHGLKEDDRLWEAYQNLREARNRYVHEGQASVGKTTVVVTSERASELVARAGEIIDWIEALLPEAERRPRYAREGELYVQYLKTLVAAEESPTVSEGASTSEE